jgi:cytoskeletal protein RodZ
MEITLNGWIGLLNLEIRDMMRSIKAFCILRLTVASLIVIVYNNNSTNNNTNIHNNNSNANNKNNNNSPNDKRVNSRPANLESKNVRDKLTTTCDFFIFI